MRLGGAVAVIACVLSTAAAAHPQADFDRLLAHCVDQTRTPDGRIDACRHLLNSTGLDPVEYAFTELNVGAAYTEKGDNASALAAYARSIALEPNMWQAYNNRIEVRGKTGDLDGALDDYFHLQKIDPAKVSMKVFGVKYASAHELPDGHGEAHEASEYDRAVADIRRKLSDALYQRGLARRASGDSSGGDADIRSALAINPGAANAQPTNGAAP